MSKPPTASPSLSGYALTNHFRRLRLREPISHLQAYLFFELIAICNEEGWPAEFSAKNAVLMAALDCSEEGLIRARLRLKAVGLIDFVSGTRRAPTRYCFKIDGSGELSNQAFGQANYSAKDSGELSNRVANTANGSGEGSGELSQSEQNPANGSAQGSGEGSGELSPYIEQTKTKTNTARRAVSAKNDVAKNDVANDVGFDAFWDAFAKKTDRVKSEKAWAKLTPAQRREAFAKVPAYVAATPELRYRKNPLTWLNGQCWLDEEAPTATPTPAPGFSAAATPAPRPVDAGSVLDPAAVAANAAAAQAAMRQRIAERQQRQASA